MPAKIWRTWRVTGFTDHVWQWQNQGTTKQLYFFSSRAKGLRFWKRKQTLFSVSDVNKLQWSYTTKRKKCPVDKILDSTCPGKQLKIIYLHFIAHRISNSSFYAYLCKTAAVIRYLYKSPSSTGEEHRAEPLASGWLTALRAGLEAGRGRDTRGCPPSAGCFSLPFLTRSVSPSSWRGAVVLHWATLAAATWQQSGYDGNIGGIAPFLGQICPLAFGP